MMPFLISLICSLSHFATTMFPLQENGQSGGNESSQRRPFPSWQTDLLDDLRLLPGYWRSWYRSLLRSCNHNYSQQWWCSGIRYDMRWKTIVDEQDPTWWYLGKFVQIKNTRVWETQDRIGIVQYGDSSEGIDADYQKMNTTVERSIDQKLRLRNFDARNERIETGQWLRIARINVVLKEDTENAINGKQKDSGRVEIIVDSSTMGISARNRHQKSAPSSEPLAQKDGRSASRRKSLRGWSPRKFAGQSCRDYMKGNCTRSFCDYWHPPEMSILYNRIGMQIRW